MKTILALGAVALLSSSAYAQQSVPVAQQGSRHMFEFNVDSALAAVIAFDRSKATGSDAENDMRTNLSLNYAYGVHRFIQAGFRMNYVNDIVGGNDQELGNVSIGAILNHTEDFTRAAYLSAYVGTGYAQDFGGGTRDETRNATVAVGKRIPLERLGIDHVTYTPEIALTHSNSVDNESYDYQQAVEFRLLQFSVFF